MHVHTVLLLLCALINPSFSAVPPSFCKCTCFTNSTIIQLGPQPDMRSMNSAPFDISPRAGAGSSSCSQCNRAFCLSNNIPICKGAEEKDVFTTCFQRDSRKDQIIVLLFIGTTVGLLGWAAVKGVLDKRKTVGQTERRRNQPLLQPQRDRGPG